MAMTRIRGSTVIGAILVAIGVIGIGAGIVNGGLRAEYTSGNYDETRTFALSTVRAIHLNVDAAKIHVFHGTTSDIKVHVYGDVTQRGSDRDLQFDAGLHGSNLDVEVKRNWQGHWFFSWPFFARNHNLHVDVEVPDGNLDELQVKASAGQLVMEDVAAALVSTDLDAGETKVKDIHGHLVARSNAGAIQIDNVSGAMDLKTDAGKISVNQADILDDIIAQTDAGAIEVKVRNAPKNLQFRLNTDLGRAVVHLPNATMTRNDHSDIEGGVGVGGPRVELRSNLGEVSLGLD
jgi:DUF4097 and DUF4098 domain-containing protein YvlB